MKKVFRLHQWQRLPRLVRWPLLLLLLGFTVLASERGLGLLYPFPVERFNHWGQSRRIYSRHGELLRLTPTEHGERLIPVKLNQFSPHLLTALITAEDKAFYTHGGVHFPAILRAIGSNLIKRKIVSGASTLTMQLTRILVPRPRSYTAKLIEAFRARQLERLLSKDKILELYLNLVPLGGTLRGFEAGSRRWFGKPALELTPPEAATLVCMLPAPSRRNPGRRPEHVRYHRNKVLARMAACGHLSPAQAASLATRPLGTKMRQWPYLASHACDYLLRRNWTDEVHTDLDLATQGLLERIIKTAPTGGVDGIGAVILARKTGRIRAMVGSRNYRTNPLNTCLCRRSAGSTLKPFLFSLAMEKGIIGPDTILHDRPTTYHLYQPENFDRLWCGRIRAGLALASSRNVPAVTLLAKVGISPFRNLLESLGINTGNTPLHLDLALGTIAISPLSLAKAWRTFGDPLASLPVAPTRRQQIMQWLKRFSPNPALLPAGQAAWKTGTSSNRRDAWTAGLVADYAIAVWMGNLDGQSAPGLVGGKYSARVFSLIAATLPRSPE